MGGGGDQANDLIFPETLDLFLQKGQEADIAFIYQADLSQSEQERIRIYDDFAASQVKGSVEPGITCFVNIGGASVNVGNTARLISLHNGLVLPSEYSKTLQPDEPGLISHFLRRNVPVIHMLNIRELALKNGIPIDASPFPAIGEGRLYQRDSYPLERAVLLGLGFLLAVGLCLPKKNYTTIK